MNENDPRLAEFESRTREVLEESVTRIDSRIRSRLNQARHAALAEAAKPGIFRWRGLGVLPAGGAVAAALLVAIVLWSQRPEQSPETAQAAFDDLELLTDDETFSLVEEGDHAFYEWAAGQAEVGQEASG